MNINSQEKEMYIKKYKAKFCFIPLVGNTKIAAIKGWGQYSFVKSNFQVEELENSNVGIVTGPASGLIVVDVDNKNLFNSFLRRNGYSIPKSHVVKTGRGEHYSVNYPNDGKDYNGRSIQLYGFDIRAIGGYVVAPYSIHEETGKVYELVNDGELQDAPAWLLDIILEKKSTSLRNLDKIIRNQTIRYLIDANIEVGKRSEAMMKVINYCVGQGLSDDEIFYIFNTRNIGEKYLEKSEHDRDQWLQSQIDKSREYVDVDVKAMKNHDIEDDFPEINCISANELAGKDCKEPQYLVNGLLERGGHLLVTAKAGTGKSMLVTNIALTLAAAPDSGLFGYEISNPLKVVIIQCENSEAFMKKRIEKICEKNPILNKGKDNVIMPYFNGRHDNSVFKLSNDNLERYIDVIYETAKPDVIIIDPLKAYSGVLENDNDQNREMLDNLFYILGKYDITAIIVHHVGRRSDSVGIDSSRGASAITDVVSNHWSVHRDKNEVTGTESFVISCAKARNFAKFDDIVLDPTDGFYFKMVDNPYDPIKLIDLLMESNGHTDTQGELIELARLRFGFSDNKIRDMITAAVKKKYISEEKYGQNKKRYYLRNYDTF